MKRTPLRRKTPLKRTGRPLSRGKGPARGPGPTKARTARWRPTAAQKAAWDARRWEALERDGFRCRRCGKAGTLWGDRKRRCSDLQAAHVVPLGSGRSRYRTDRAINALWNLVTLCPACHDGQERHAWAWEEIGVVPDPALRGVVPQPVWVRCNRCEEFWCRLHKAHASECRCPPIEEWGGVDPYASRVA